jgi:hypothetical protein
MPFIKNKYSNWYYSIIINAQLRTNIGYIEKHHIIPKSLNGKNTKDNLVSLTAREHFLCHWLLTKMTNGTNRNKMLVALNFMRAATTKQYRYSTKITSRVYSKLKEELSPIRSEANRNRAPISDSTRAKISAGLCGRTRTTDSKEKMSKLMTGKNNPMFGKAHSTETRAKYSLERAGENNPMFGRTHSNATKQKIAEAKIGKKLEPFTDEHRANMSAAAKARWANR